MATDIQTIPLKTINGKDATLGDYAGKVLLAVNVGLRCQFTKYLKLATVAQWPAFPASSFLACLIM